MEIPRAWIAIFVVLTSCAPPAAENRPALQTTCVIPTASPVAPEDPTLAVTYLPDEPAPPGAASEFTTNFSRHSVPYSEILSGGPSKDGIPALDAPAFVSVAEADSWLEPNEPVVFLEIGADARAYPIQILIWHELANDTVANQPVVVSFCPLCNTAIVFERTVAGEIVSFGTTGRLRFSNLIMYDRQTETWWQQATGDAIAGTLTGNQLRAVPAVIIAWSDFATAHPQGQVLSRQTGFNRSYGENPYVGYDDVNRPPFLYRGPATSDALPPMARVLTVELGGEAVAYPYETLRTIGVANDVVGGVPISVFWIEGTASALDAATVAGGRDVGASAAFERTLEDRTLTFARDGDRIVDTQTGSTWDIFGQAVSGPLQAKSLTPVVAINHFWFSWSVFRPQTRVCVP